MRTNLSRTNLSRVIYVMEGPAGCGKSTMIKSLQEQFLWKPPAEHIKFERPRAYLAETGIVLSQVKDYLSMLSALIDMSGVPLVLDRWGMSQWVYGSIRSGVTPGISTGLGILVSTIRTVQAGYREFLYRSGSGFQDLKISLDLRFVVLLPSVEILNQNRSSCGKEYPYHPQVELRCYEAAAKYISRRNSSVNSYDGLKVSCQPMRITSYSDYGSYTFGLSEDLRETARTMK